MVPLKFGKLWAGNNAKNIRGKPDISNKCFVHSPAADMQKITLDHLKICNGGRSCRDCIGYAHSARTAPIMELPADFFTPGSVLHRIKQQKNEGHFRSAQKGAILHGETSIFSSRRIECLSCKLVRPK